MGTWATQGAAGASAGPGAGHPSGLGRGGAQGAPGSMDAEAARRAAGKGRGGSPAAGPPAYFAGLLRGLHPAYRVSVSGLVRALRAQALQSETVHRALRATRETFPGVGGRAPQAAHLWRPRSETAGGPGVGIYPVDILEDDPAGHQEATLAYYAMLGEGVGPSPEVFSLPTGEQVKLEASSVCFCTVHRDEPQHKILVLVNPRDTKTVVAVYVKQSWWTTEDVLRTSDPSREGLMQVQSFGERIVLFILNVVIFGRLERNLDDDDMFFLPHSVKEEAKILWRDGAAVGFYTTKRKGSLCGDGTGTCYLLPVFDTVFVRRRHRRRGLGLAMLRDFCQTFREDEALGVSWPISPAMYQDVYNLKRVWSPDVCG
ncbi:protein FAM169B-like [Oryx dammah]|uniref:protein FAM169B-like n=1 Tax=Oryx dammah TaxID=59534 RepID=UPI001A9B221D|nr:protein FAM169B-like [Oryx dammah]